VRPSVGTQCNMECLPHVAPLPSMSALYYPSLQFLDALDLIAGKKGVPLGAVVAAVAGGGGPAVNNTTVGEFVKFHDDKSTYTGKPCAGMQGSLGAAGKTGTSVQGWVAHLLPECGSSMGVSVLPSAAPPCSLPPPQVCMPAAAPAWAATQRSTPLPWSAAGAAPWVAPRAASSLPTLPAWAARAPGAGAAAPRARRSPAAAWAAGAARLWHLPAALAGRRGSAWAR
jgi:hypothetical protein